MKSTVLLFGAMGTIPAQELPRFSTEVQLVMLDVQVTESGTGRVADLLGPKDFEISEKGRNREIREFHFGTTPLDIIFLVYGKSGVGPVKDINEFRRGLNAAAAELRLGDRAAIVHTASESMIDLPMTDDLAKVGHTIAFGKYRMGYDHLYDAVHVATTLFIRPNDLSRRRAILAITDDVERGSKTGIEPLITEILEADATLNEVICVWGTRSHEVGLGGVWGIPRVSRTIGTPRDGDSLSAATQATGGEAVPGDQFREQLPALVRRLRMRYLLGFYAEPSLQTQKEFRPIEVRLTPDAQKRYPNARIRVRRGYYAEPVSLPVR